MVTDIVSHECLPSHKNIIGAYGPTMMNMRQRRGTGYSPTSTIDYNDVETCCSIPQQEKPVKRRLKSSSCSKLMKRLVLLALFVGGGVFAYHHCQRAYELYNLPGVKELLKEAPPVLGNDYIVFLTASTGQPGETYVKMGRSSRSATHALAYAQATIAKIPKKFPWIKIDVVDVVQTLKDYDYFSSIDVPGDWCGVSLDWSSSWAFLPEEIQAHGLMDKENVLRWEKLTSYARSKKLKGWPIPDHSDDTPVMASLDVFHTESIFYDLDTSGTTPIPVYHGHRMYEKITPQVLHTAMTKAGEYLAQSVADDTKKFVYTYSARGDNEPEGYSLADHAAAVYTMTRLYSEWNDPKLLHGLQKAMEHLLAHVQLCSVPGDSGNRSANCLVEHDPYTEYSELGLNALTVLAIAEYAKATKETRHWRVATSIATWIAGTKQKDGSFVHRVQLPDFKVDHDDYFNRDFHGQVAFALSSLYKTAKVLGVSSDEAWIEVASAAAEHQVSLDNEDDEDEESTFDYWLLRGIGELPSSNVSPTLVEYAIKSAQFVMDHQNDETNDADALDELGIFFDDFSVTNTATKTHGLCAVYHLAVEQGRKEDLDSIAESVIMGLRHQLQNQYSPEHAMYLKNPKRILGGFHESVIDTGMRLEHTYHNIGSILCTREMLNHRSEMDEVTTKQE